MNNDEQSPELYEASSILYVIGNFRELFMAPEMRSRKRCLRVTIATGFEARWVTKLSRLRQPHSILGAFLAIVLCAGKMKIAGVLFDDGPLNADDLHAITRLPRSVFERALRQLAEPSIGLIQAFPIFMRDGRWELPTCLAYLAAPARPRKARAKAQQHPPAAWSAEPPLHGRN